MIPEPVITSSTSETAEIPLVRMRTDGLKEITCHAVDSNGDYVAASSGTGALEVITASGTEYEPVVQQDGTTPRQFDFTGDSTSFSIENDVTHVRVVPSSLSGNGAAGIRLAVKEPNPN